MVQTAMDGQITDSTHMPTIHECLFLEPCPDF
jgi:hypothetical protein